MTGAVLLNVRARAESGIRIAALPVHAIVLGDAGQRWRVRDDGGLDDLPPGGHPRPGIASDPTARRRAP